MSSLLVVYNWISAFTCDSSVSWRRTWCVAYWCVWEWSYAIVAFSVGTNFVEESLVMNMIGMRMIACIMVLRFVVLSLSMPSVKGTQEAVRVGRPIPVLSYLKLQNFKVFITTSYRRVRPGPRPSFIALTDEAKFGVFTNREMRVQWWRSHGSLSPLFDTKREWSMTGRKPISCPRDEK